MWNRAALGTGLRELRSGVREVGESRSLLSEVACGGNGVVVRGEEDSVERKEQEC